MANVFGGTTAGFGAGQQQTAGGGGGGSNNNNSYVVPGARQALESFKNQTASELGIQNYAQQYKGDLPSRVNGSVGGFMVKKMIALAEQQLSGGTAGAGGVTTR